MKIITEDAIALFKTYMGENYKDEPTRIEAIGNTSFITDYDALIKKD